MEGEPYVLHRCSVSTPAPRTYRVECSCGQLLYLGSNPSLGEAAENRHIHEYLGGFQPPPSHHSIDWDRIASLFLIGWLLSDRND